MPKTIDKAVLRKLGMSDDKLESLNEEELAYTFQCLEEMAETGTSATALSLVLEDYKWEPVSMERFLSDSYYMGDLTHELYPLWRACLIEMFDTDARPVEVIFAGAIGVGKCLAAHELCSTGSGLLTMAEVYATRPSRVQTRNGVKAIAEYHTEGLTDTLRVVTKHGHTLEGRASHRLLVVNARAFTTEWRRLDELVEGDVLVQHPSEVFGNRHASPALAELAGWAVAEGSWADHRMRLNISRDEVPYLTGLIAKAGAYIHTQYRDARGKGVALMVRYPDALKDYFVSARSETQEIPRAIREGTRDTWCAFLRGYFSGDGTVSRGRASVTTVSPILAQQVRVMLTLLGVYAIVTDSVTGYRDADGEMVRCQRRYVVSTAGLESRQVFAKEIGFVHGYKQNALLGGLRDNANADHSFSFKVDHIALGALQPKCRPGEAKSRGLNKTTTPSGLIGRLRTQGCTVKLLRQIRNAGGVLPDCLASLVDGASLFDTVRRVERSRAHCYDLSVNGDPSYVAAGFVSHNTSVAAIIQTYLTYRLTCLRDPHAYYSLIKGQPIVIGMYSIDLEQAMATSYGKILNWLDAIPYFLQKCPRVKRINSVIKFTGSPVQIVAGSKETHTIGKDLFSFLLDECNFLQAPNGKVDEGVAVSLYTNAVRRVKSRFMRSGGEPAGMAILASSKRTKAAFLEQHVKESTDDIREGKTRLFSYAQWEVKPASTYKKPRFRVEVGDRMNPSRVLRPGEDPREGADVMNVPGEYHQDFQNDVDKALRDLAGVASESMMPLFHDKSVILRACTAEHQHPFSRPEISTTILDDIGIDEYFQPHMMFRVVRSKYELRLNPSCPRYIHIDVAFTKDSMGMAMCHMSGMRTVRRARRDGTWYEDKAPLVTVDFVLRICPPQGGEIDLAKARAFILNLIDMGVPVKMVSYDWHQSRDSVQALKKVGIHAFNTKIVDENDQAYLMLRQCMVEDRLIMYEYKHLNIELSELERDVEKSKVDHPKRSSATGRPGCFAGETRVRLADGTTPTMKELADAGVGGLIHTVSSSGVIVKAPFTNPRLTAKSVPVVRVSFSNGKTVRCTPDHRFLTGVRIYAEACILTVCTPLCTLPFVGDKPTHVWMTSYTPDGVADVYDISVPDTENFALAHGPFVHNSKDVADALVGCVYAASCDKEAALLMAVPRHQDPATVVTSAKVHVTGGSHLWSNLDKEIG